MTELAGVEVIDCPTAANAPCGCCPSCLAQQAADPRYGSPSDLDHP